MRKTCKRLIALLTVLSLIFIGYPVKAVDETPDETVTEPVQTISACAPSEGVFCDFSIDVNTVHRYIDSVIPLDFTVFGMDEGEVYTIQITSSVEITHNIPATQQYSRANNDVSIRINVLEKAVTQSLDALIFEHITIDLINSNSEVVFTIDASIINTQYGLFVGYINDECLFNYYGVWLLENGFITQENYDEIIERRLTATPIESSGVQTYAVTSYTKSSMYVSYEIDVLNSGQTLDINVNVYWVDTNGNIHPARGVAIFIIDRDTSNEDDLLTSGYTTLSGAFSALCTNQTSTTENGGCDITIKVQSENFYAKIVSSGDLVYNFSVNCGSNIASPKNGNATYGDDKSNISRAFSILDAIYTGGLHVKAMSGSNLASVNVIYPWSGILVSHYNPVNSVIHLEEEDYASWDIVLHEYGHYVADCNDIFPFVAVEHDMDYNAITYICTEGLWNVGSTIVSSIKYDGCALAWQEGWANYFSVASQIQQNTNNMGIGGVGNVAFDGFDLEVNYNTAGTTEKPGKVEACELAVARVLWDLADTSSTTGSSDGDLTNLGFSNVWRYTTESGAGTFSEFMSYLYSRFSKTSATFRNLGALLETQQISANLLYPNISSSQASVAWRGAYSDAYVGSNYYLDVYDSNMTRVYSQAITSSPAVISGSTWTNLCNNYSSGMYICVRTVPKYSATGYTDGYNTGPYYSEFVYHIPG